MNLHSLAPIIIAPLVSSNSITTLLLIPLMILAFYFLLIRPQRKRQQQQQRMLSELGPGSRVLTHTGIFGTVISLGDKQAELEIAPGIRIAVLRQTIARAVRPEDEDAAPVDDATSAGAEPAPVGPVDTLPTQDAPAPAPGTAGTEEADSDTGSGGIRDVTSTYFSREGESDAEQTGAGGAGAGGAGAGETGVGKGQPSALSHQYDDEPALSSTLPTGDEYADQRRGDDDRDRGDRQADKDA